MNSGDLATAEHLFRRAVAFDRNNPDYLNKLGIANGELGNFRAAEQAFRRAVKLRPAHAEAHHNLGKTLQKQDRLTEALKEFERAHALSPDSLAHLLSLSAVHRQLGQPALALKALRSAGPSYEIDLSPYLADCIADVAGAPSAVTWLREVLARHPDARRAQYVLAIYLLSLGHWREGWELHASRGRPIPQLPPRLNGRRILLRAEYGLGDVLFFLRFAAEVAARGATLALECPPRLRPLLADRMAFGQADGVGLEIWVPDLPTALRAEDTPAALALDGDEARVAITREQLARLGPPPYLGITWRAGTDVLRGPELGTNLQVLSKEIPPGLLGKALRGWRGTLVSLQRNPSAEEHKALSTAVGAPVHDLSNLNEDLRVALAVVALLDEYVAVSNTNIHLRAGIGRTARVLVPNPPEWRWMRTEGGSPWFPGFSVYRQPPSRDWSDALRRLREDLLGGSAPRAPA